MHLLSFGAVTSYVLLHLAASPAAQVRVGVSIHHSVQSVALDTLVEHRLGGDASRVRDSMAARCAHPRWDVGCTSRGEMLLCRAAAVRSALCCRAAFVHLPPPVAPSAQTVARWEKDRLRMQILEEANIGEEGCSCFDCGRLKGQRAARALAWSSREVMCTAAQYFSMDQYTASLKHTLAPHFSSFAPHNPTATPRSVHHAILQRQQRLHAPHPQV
jgi:hypothetical protein